MYAEVSKSVAEPKVSANHAPPKLKGIFRAERHEVEREMWRQESEVTSLTDTRCFFFGGSVVLDFASSLFQFSSGRCPESTSIVFLMQVQRAPNPARRAF